MERPQHWLSKVEKIFTVMGFYEEHKVTYATYMLSGEAEDWWKFASQTLPSNKGVISWVAFNESLLDNYFQRDLHKQTTREFLELKQGSMIVGEYALKFHELMKYQPYCKNGENGENICAQFKNNLRADIQTTVSVFQIIDLPTL